VGNFPRGREILRLLESWKSMLRTGASSGAHDFRTVAGVPSGSLDLELLS